MKRKPVISTRTEQNKSAIKNLPSYEAEIVDALTTEQADVLTNAKAYWFFAEWQQVEDLLSNDVLKLHPERGYLHLLLGTALLQLGKVERAQSCIQVAKSSGQQQTLVKRMLLSGAYQTLANIALLREQKDVAEQYYAKSLNLAGVKEQAISAQSRKLKAMSNFGQLEQAVTEIDLLLSANHGLTRADTATLLQQIKKEQNKLKCLIGAYAQAGYSAATQTAELDAAALLVERCFNQQSIIEAMESINDILASEQYSKLVIYNFCYLVALRFAELKDNIMAVHYLNNAIEWLSEEAQRNEFEQLSRLALELGQAELCIDLLVKAKAADSTLTKAEQQRLVSSYAKIRSASLQKQQHGHDLIIAYINQHKELWRNGEKQRLFVEIGTTRELVPGQGSTMLIAEMCVQYGFDFITVDMDPNNGRLAEAAFQRHKYPYRAVTNKGESYLSNFHGVIDFIFLDAYDFDHGKHSALRQSRYLKYLGGSIDEQQCHKMHLDCVIALKDKLAPDGLICVDDTWLDESNNWTAKGTTAVPFLLENGFEIIEARNRAVLLKRVAK